MPGREGLRPNARERWVKACMMPGRDGLRACMMPGRDGLRACMMPEREGLRPDARERWDDGLRPDARERWVKA